MRPDKEIRMYCRGNGGSCRTAFAIIDIIQQHGNVVGLLTSEANSNHGVVFAGCPRRYVYPRALLGLHRTALDELYHVDSPYARNRYDELEAGDRANAESTQPPAKIRRNGVKNSGISSLISREVMA